jgi:diphosphomevalonate decarboxylase
MKRVIIRQICLIRHSNRENTKNTMSKSTYRAFTDVALIKYWGKRNAELRIPENNSLSLVLDGLSTVTTVEFQDDLATDDITIGGSQNPVEVQRVQQHLDRIRERAGVSTSAKVVSENNFPRGTGLSSSGSGFAALTYAATAALDMQLPQKDMSILARLASGTACRCVCGGIVEWHAGDSSDTSYSETVFPANHWQLSDVVAVVSESMKRVSSTEGHKSARSSAFFPVRQQHINGKLDRLKQAIRDRDFESFGAIVESEALEFHSILLTSQPPLVAWHPGTIEVMQTVQNLRADGVPVYFTINTGFNVHLLTLPDHAGTVEAALNERPLVRRTLRAGIGEAPQALDEHLF